MIAVDSIKKALKRRKHVRFMKHCWVREDPFIVGKHTTAMCNRLDRAIKDFRRGKSSFLLMTVPFRHGKSDIVSRYLPPHFLGEFPDKEVLLASYSDDKAHEFSRFGRKLVRSKEYQELYPRISPTGDTMSVKEWEVVGEGKKQNGKAQFAGLAGSITGRGGDLLVLDDYCKNREQAESEAWRKKTWEGFTNDFMTRRAPVCICIILVTPWHVDDVTGRIREKMKSDPDFPQFEEICYPAMSKDYPSGYLFPERFDKKWYDGMAATLGEYGTSALLQCNPTLRGGNLLRVDKIKYIRSDVVWNKLTKGLRGNRGWDLASSVKEKAKDDPDYTSGAHTNLRLIGTNDPQIKIPVLFIGDYVRGRWEGIKRNLTIKATAIGDTTNTRQGIEAFGGYKDAYTTLKRVLLGIRIVKKVNLPGDKLVKADPLVPIFEAGNVYMKVAPWNAPVVKQMKEFPYGKHDDDVDALAVSYSMHSVENSAGFGRANI